MESSSEAMRVHLSGAAHEQLVAEKSKLACTSRGVIDIKGKGECVLGYELPRCEIVTVLGR